MGDVGEAILYFFIALVIFMAGFYMGMPKVGRMPVPPPPMPSNEDKA